MPAEEDDFRCQHCGGLYPIDRSQKPPHVCPHCGNAAYFLFAMETTLGELVAAVRASGQPCEIRLEPIQDGLVLFTAATGTMGTRRYALDRENLAHPVEEPDPEADSWLSVGTPEWLNTCTVFPLDNLLTNKERSGLTHTYGR